LMLTAVAAIALTLMSTILGLSVVWLHWFSLADLTQLRRGDDAFINEKFKKFESRTIRYKSAWLMSLCATMLIGIIIFLRLKISSQN
jgi:hypothetical protein